MRDYSFGKFISALRERCGLSQFQLGALVGVSDKAVSKWENGASKPRINTMKKLAEVLDVSVGELLTCEYDTFNKERKDLFAMKREVLHMARRRMKQLYGDNPPTRIANRFKSEELMLAGQEELLWMGFMSKLHDIFCREDAYCEVRGAKMGASFIAWLLGGTTTNPLQAHYYCPVCKKVEFITDEKVGIDLPDKSCACGNIYQKDGFGIDAVNMYPFMMSYEVYISSGTTKLVKECLQEHFAGYGIIREIQIVCNDEDVKVSDNLTVTRFALFSKEDGNRYPEEIISLTIDDYFNLLNEVTILTLIENLDETICNSDLHNLNLKSQQIKEYFNHVVKYGVTSNPIGDIDLSVLLSDIDTPKFSDLLVISGFSYGMGVWEGNGEELYKKGVKLDDLISNREDIYTYLYAKLGKCCENPSGLAFEIMESVRKGKYCNGMPKETEQLLLECDVPEWYIESMKKIQYLFPKTQMIVRLKHDICAYEKQKYMEGTN